MIPARDLLAVRKRIFDLNARCADGAADGADLKALSLDLFDLLKAHGELGLWERVHLAAVAAALKANWRCLALSHLWLAAAAPEERAGASCAQGGVSPGRLRNMLAGA